jgi:hypothetical protein
MICFCVTIKVGGGGGNRLPNDGSTKEAWMIGARMRVGVVPHRPQIKI